MEITAHDPSIEDEIPVRLSTLKGGEVFRFTGDTYEDALKAELFYMRVTSPEKDKDGRCLAASVKGNELRVFDGTHWVILHEATLFIKPNT